MHSCLTNSFVVRLPKTGKPKDNEYTSLAAIIQVRSQDTHSDPRVVCLSTGTKCVTGTESRIENIIRDCHAESLCKRAFKRFLIYESSSGQPYDGSSEYSFFLSKLPCGTIERYAGAACSNDIKTGVRKKPGRGEPSLKASCVDKLCKWLQMGIQGCHLLSYTQNPVIFTHVIIGNCVDHKEFNEMSLRQSVVVDEMNPSQHKKRKTEMSSSMPDVFFDEDFKHELLIKRDDKSSSPSAIVCWMEDGMIQKEVVVSGRKQGTSIKNFYKNQLRISRGIMRQDMNQLECMKSPDGLDLMRGYQEKWQQLLKTDRLKGWGDHRLAQDI